MSLEEVWEALVSRAVEYVRHHPGCPSLGGIDKACTCGAVRLLEDMERAAADSPAPLLFDAIAHGDAEHRAWLRLAIDAHFAGQPIPPLAGSGNKEKRIAELEARVRACREALVAVREDFLFVDDDGETRVSEDISVETFDNVCKALSTLDEGVGSSGGDDGSALRAKVTPYWLQGVRELIARVRTKDWRSKPCALVTEEWESDGFTGDPSPLTLAGELEKALDAITPVAPALTSEQGEKLATVGKYRKRSPIVTAWRWQGQPESEWPTWLNGLEPMLRNGLDYGWGFVDQSPYRARTVTPSDFEREFEPLSEAGDLVGKVVEAARKWVAVEKSSHKCAYSEIEVADDELIAAVDALDALSPSEGERT